MKLFVFDPRKIGYDTFYVMSETIENAIKSLEKLPDGGAYLKFKEEYKFWIFDLYKPSNIFSGFYRTLQYIFAKSIDLFYLSFKKYPSLAISPSLLFSFKKKYNNKNTKFIK